MDAHAVVEGKESLELTLNRVAEVLAGRLATLVQVVPVSEKPTLYIQLSQHDPSSRARTCTYLSAGPVHTDGLISLSKAGGLIESGR